MLSPDLVWHEITSPSDPLFLPWLDLYETAFPPAEKLLVSFLLKLLAEPVESRSSHMIAVMDSVGDFAGLLLYELRPALGAALLWYLAVPAARRSQGLGAVIYRDLLSRLDPSIYKALLYEVEIPADHNHFEAGRRIAFYHRSGAFLLQGIDYLQEVGGHVPPQPMHLMVHPLLPLEPASAFALAAACFGTCLRQSGPLSLA